MQYDVVPERSLLSPYVEVYDNNRTGMIQISERTDQSHDSMRDRYSRVHGDWADRIVGGRWSAPGHSGSPGVKSEESFERGRFPPAVCSRSPEMAHARTLKALGQSLFLLDRLCKLFSSSRICYISLAVSEVQGIEVGKFVWSVAHGSEI